jgi:tetratricopeptide (TPR) repeat protein
LKRALENAERIGEEAGDPASRAIPKAFMGAYLTFIGRLREGAELMNDALRTLEGRGDPRSTAMLTDFLAATYARLGEFARADEALARSERLAQTGDEIARLDATLTRAGINVERGEVEDGQALASQCAMKSEELGAVACAVGANVTLGTAHFRREDVLGAKASVERGYELSLAVNLAPMRTLAQGMLGSIRTRLGDQPAGAAEWRDALAAARAMNDRSGEAATLWLRGLAYANQPSPEWKAALDDLDAAGALIESMEARPTLARVQRDRARVLRGLGRNAEAEDSDRRARELARELGLKDFAATS